KPLTCRSTNPGASHSACSDGSSQGSTCEMAASPSTVMGSLDVAERPLQIMINLIFSQHTHRRHAQGAAITRERPVENGNFEQRNRYRTAKKDEVFRVELGWCVSLGGGGREFGFTRNLPWGRFPT